MTTAARERLRPRRPAVTETIRFGRGDGSVGAYDATVGFSFGEAAVRPREIFLSGAREGSEMAAVLADAAVVVSLALQYGIPAAVLAHSMSRVPLPSAGPTAEDGQATAPGSVIGAAVELVLRHERELALEPGR